MVRIVSYQNWWSTKNHQQAKPKYNKRALTNRKRAILEHPDKEIKNIAPPSHTELLLQNTNPQRHAGKAEHSEMQKQKEAYKMRRQRKNLQLKRMEESSERAK